MEWQLCALRFLTGLDCPGCGLLRSLVALVRGDLEASVVWHPMGVLVALWALSFWWWRRVRLSKQAQRWIGYAIVGGFFVPWIVGVIASVSEAI